MAILSGNFVNVVSSLQVVQIPPVPIYHPSYAYMVTVPSSNKEGVQKQAAENFKWGR
jgi:hypothetical protein